MAEHRPIDCSLVAQRCLGAALSLDSVRNFLVHTVPELLRKSSLRTYQRALLPPILDRLDDAEQALVELCRQLCPETEQILR